MKQLKGQFPMGLMSRIKRIRKSLGMRCKLKRKFKVTMHSNHGLPVAVNLLKQEFSTERANQVCVTDIRSSSGGSSR